MKSENLKHDISLEVVAPPSLNASESSHFNHWMSLSDDGILIIDREGTILEINEQLCELLGYSMESLIGSTIEELHPRSQFPRVLRTLETIQAHGEGELWETRILRKDKGIVFVQIKGCLSDFENADAIYLVYRDVSERRQLQMEQKRLQTQLQSAQKLESLGVLAGTIAHDFNNHLVGILGNAGLALLELDEEDSARQCVTEIESAALKATELTKQMLAYSGNRKPQVGPVDIRDVIEGVGHLLEASTSKKVSVSYQIAINLPKVQADAAQLQQVLINLLTNASEAIGKDVGEIAILSGVVDADSEYLSGTCFDDELPEGQYVYLEVSDSGCGMPDETTTRVFDPFFSTKATGRGLGMAAVLGIIRVHRGAIVIRSASGSGTTVRVLLPTTELTGLSGTASEEELRAWEAEGTILIADDEEAVRTVAERMLERYGFTVMTAKDGQDALTQFEEHHHDIVAVLLDMSMPRLSGEEAVTQMRKLKPGIPVILSTGYSQEEVMDRFAGVGPVAFIQKPYRTLELAKRMYLTLGLNSENSPQ